MIWRHIPPFRRQALRTEFIIFLIAIGFQLPFTQMVGFKLQELTLDACLAQKLFTFMNLMP